MTINQNNRQKNEKKRFGCNTFNLLIFPLIQLLCGIRVRGAFAVLFMHPIFANRPLKRSNPVSSGGSQSCCRNAVSGSSFSFKSYSSPAVQVLHLGIPCNLHRLARSRKRRYTLCYVPPESIRQTLQCRVYHKDTRLLSQFLSMVECCSVFRERAFGIN